MQKGDLVTVRGWIKSDDGSFKGDVLEILAVDEPYLAVHNRTIDIRFSLDTRQVTLQRVSAEYAEALKPARGIR